MLRRPIGMRFGSVVGVFVMIAITATIAAAAGQIVATGLGALGPGRFAAADAVARANPTVKLGHGDEADAVDVQRAALLPPTALERVQAIPGVTAATDDVAFPLTVTGPGGRRFTPAAVVPCTATGGRARRSRPTG